MPQQVQEARWRVRHNGMHPVKARTLTGALCFLQRQPGARNQLRQRPPPVPGVSCTTCCRSSPASAGPALTTTRPQPLARRVACMWALTPLAALQTVRYRFFCCGLTVWLSSNVAALGSTASNSTYSELDLESALAFVGEQADRADRELSASRPIDRRMQVLLCYRRPPAQAGLTAVQLTTLHLLISALASDTNANARSC